MALGNSGLSSFLECSTTRPKLPLSASATRLSVSEDCMAPSTAQATFYANVATLRNQMINLLSGAAVSAAEERRMLDQLPDPTQNPSVFRANLAAMIGVAGGAPRWRPHVKTAKLGAVMQLMLDAGDDSGRR